MAGIVGFGLIEAGHDAHPREVEPRNPIVRPQIASVGSGGLLGLPPRHVFASPQDVPDWNYSQTFRAAAALVTTLTPYQVNTPNF